MPATSDALVLKDGSDTSEIYIQDDQIILASNEINLSGDTNFSSIGSVTSAGLGILGTTLNANSLSFFNSANAEIKINALTGTNVAGRNLVIASGLGTGTGSSSGIDFKIAVPTTAGSGAQSYYTAMAIGGSYVGVYAPYIEANAIVTLDFTSNSQATFNGPVNVNGDFGIGLGSSGSDISGFLN
jgi:hypothetical protein